MSGDNLDIMHPTVLWAQRKEYLYITICIGDIQEKKLNLKDESFAFSGLSGIPARKYEVNLDFFDKIIPDDSKQISTDREIVMLVKKASPSYWPGVIKKSGPKPHWLKTDFNRWKDEDDSDADEDDFGGGDFSQMMSQMGGFDDSAKGAEVADEEIDSDDEELPDLKE